MSSAENHAMNTESPVAVSSRCLDERSDDEKFRTRLSHAWEAEDERDRLVQEG